MPPPTNRWAIIWGSNIFNCSIMTTEHARSEKATGRPMAIKIIRAMRNVTRVIVMNQSSAFGPTVRASATNLPVIRANIITPMHNPDRTAEKYRVDSGSPLIDM